MEVSASPANGAAPEVVRTALSIKARKPSNSSRQCDDGDAEEGSNNGPAPSVHMLAVDHLTDENFALNNDVQQVEKEYEGELVNLPDDVYNLFFVSSIGGQAFFYALYVFLLKMVIFTFLTLDTMDGRITADVVDSVKASQFLMLPIAIAIQDDLMSTYYIFCNVRYWSKIQQDNPHATRRKFYLANIFRAIDGHYSLVVNFLILLTATEVLSLFLNFAALQFLQTIDNIAIKLAADGYLSETLEREAVRVVECKLPFKRTRGYFKYVDSAIFTAVLVIMVVIWGIANFGTF